MNEDIEAEAIELAAAQSPLTNMQVAELLAEIERLKDAAAFDKAIFAGERTMRQSAITRALDAEAEIERLREALVAARNFIEHNTYNSTPISRFDAVLGQIDAALEAKPE